MTPSSTNMRNFAPSKSDVPSVLVIQSIVVEYAEGYIIVERIDSRELPGVPRSFR